jgi:hypothetical protein
MGSYGIVALLVAVVAVVVDAQSRAGDVAALKANLDRLFDILPLYDGLALHPKSATTGVRSIEVASGIIAMNGRPVTGAELRTTLGADADLILSLSYLSDEERRTLVQAPSADDVPAATSNESAAPSQSSQSSRRSTVRRRSSGNRITIGGNVTVREGEVVAGDVAAVGGSATIDGEVLGSVAAVGGDVTLGPHAVVGKDLVTVGGRLIRDPGARVEGEIHEVGFSDLFKSRRWDRNVTRETTLRTPFMLAGTILRLAILCICCALVILLGRPYADRAGMQAAREPVKSWAIGFLAQLLFLPVLVLVSIALVITLIGIPLLFILIPLFLGAICLVALVGFAGVAHVIGQKVSAHLRWTEINPYVTTSLGVMVVLLPLLLARLLEIAGGLLGPVAFSLQVLGLCVEYLVWTMGIGAVALTRYHRQAPPADSASVTGAVVSA